VGARRCVRARAGLRRHARPATARRPRHLRARAGGDRRPGIRPERNGEEGAVPAGAADRGGQVGQHVRRRQAAPDDQGAARPALGTRVLAHQSNRVLTARCGAGCRRSSSRSTSCRARTCCGWWGPTPTRRRVRDRGRLSVADLCGLRPRAHARREPRDGDGVHEQRLAGAVRRAARAHGRPHAAICRPPGACANGTRVPRVGAEMRGA
jgi:hypothetical protein